MGTNIYELNCPFCDKLYKLPRDKVLKHAGKSIHCRKCGKPFSIPVVPPDEPPAEAEFEDIPIAYEVASPAVEPPAVEARVSAQAPAIEPPIPEPLAVEPPALEPPTAEAAAVEPGPPAPEPLPAEPPAEEIPLTPVFVAGEAFEPPPLSEYTSEPIAPAAIESSDENPAEQFTEPPVPPVMETASQEQPQESSYFSAGAITAEHFAEASDEHLPFPKDELEPPSESAVTEPAEAVEEGISESVLAESAATGEDDALGIDMHLGIHDEVKEIERSPERIEPLPMEAPPPQLVPVPVSSPPPAQPRHGARVPVTPVFDSVPEEPAPRRRGRFGLHFETAQPSDEPSVEVSAADHPPAVAAELPVIEMPPEEPAVMSESAGQDESGTKPQPSAGDAAALALSETAPIPANTEASAAPMVVSAGMPDDWATIRRIMILLGTMSVIIALTLIAILLAIIGIIPKK